MQWHVQIVQVERQSNLSVNYFHLCLGHRQMAQTHSHLSKTKIVHNIAHCVDTLMNYLNLLTKTPGFMVIANKQINL